VSALLMRNTIMTEKIARRGVRVPVDYAPDFLGGVLVREAMSGKPITLRDDQTLASARAWINARGPGTSHQGFPLLNAGDHLVGVLTRRDLLDPSRREDDTTPLRELLRRPPVISYEDATLREAADHMVNHDIGRLPVLDRSTRRVVGVITRSDLLRAHRRRLREAHEAEEGLLSRNGSGG
jgi:CBS domain-containing protein